MIHCTNNKLHKGKKFNLVSKTVGRQKNRTFSDARQQNLKYLLALQIMTLS